jgi:hypothetical protein
MLRQRTNLPKVKPSQMRSWQPRMMVNKKVLMSQLPWPKNSKRKKNNRWSKMLLEMMLNQKLQKEPQLPLMLNKTWLSNLRKWDSQSTHLKKPYL